MVNDADPRIFAFWDAIVNSTDRFLSLLRRRPLTVDEWRRQRRIYLHHTDYSPLSVGFASFYLNRCNRSGIIANAGLIGGLKQKGKWKIDARFNRTDLERRVERIAKYSDRIQVSGLDALDLLRRTAADDAKQRSFVYLDPPYYEKGSQLYMNHYQQKDHEELATFLKGTPGFKWVMSYDNAKQVQKLYSGFRRVGFHLGYSAREWREGNELLIFDDSLSFPRSWRYTIPKEFISAAGRISSELPGNGSRRTGTRASRTPVRRGMAQ